MKTENKMKGVYSEFLSPKLFWVLFQEKVPKNKKSLSYRLNYKKSFHFFPMQTFSLDSIGTHLNIQIDTSLSCEADFSEITTRLGEFEQKFSRFIAGNWLAQLNTERRATLDQDGRTMLTYALDIAQKTQGYFDPTIGSVLARLGYGPTLDHDHSVSYRDVTIVDDEVVLMGNVLLEFGGVGKGYLLDVLVDILDHHTRFLINF